MTRTPDSTGIGTTDGALFDEMMSAVIALGNSKVDLAEEGDDEAGESEGPDLWEVSDGLLAGAIQFWLFAHEPCGAPDCQDCAPVSTAALRMKELLAQVTQFAEQSDYYHSPNDADAGHA